MVTEPAAVLDLTALTKDLETAGRDAQKVIDEWMLSLANQIAADMQRLAPRRTGKLVASIRVQQLPGKIVIGPNVKYGVFQEFGTGARGEFPTRPYEIKPRNANVLSFTVNGKRVYAQKVIHPGIRPHPFARPAAQLMLDSLGDRAAEVGAQFVVGKRE